MTDAPGRQERYAGALMNTFGPPSSSLARGEGAHVWDADGKEYVDLLGGIAVNSLGHAHPAVVAAVTAQLATLGHVSNFFASEPQITPGRAPARAAPRGRGALAGTGRRRSSSPTPAPRPTRRRSSSPGVPAAPTWSPPRARFHGRTMGALALTAKAAYREPFEPLPGDVTFVPYGDADGAGRGRHRRDGRGRARADPGRGRRHRPARRLPRGARRITREHGALLWLDEVQTGIGRTGEWFAATTTPASRPTSSPSPRASAAASRSAPASALGRRGRPAPAGQPRHHVRRQPGRLRRGAGGPRHDRGRRPARAARPCWASGSAPGLAADPRVTEVARPGPADRDRPAVDAPAAVVAAARRTASSSTRPDPGRSASPRRWSSATMTSTRSWPPGRGSSTTPARRDRSPRHDPPLPPRRRPQPRGAGRGAGPGRRRSSRRRTTPAAWPDRGRSRPSTTSRPCAPRRPSRPASPSSAATR